MLTRLLPKQLAGEIVERAEIGGGNVVKRALGEPLQIGTERLGLGVAWKKRWNLQDS